MSLPSWVAHGRHGAVNYNPRSVTETQSDWQSTWGGSAVIRMSSLGALGAQHCGLEELRGPRHESHARKRGSVSETEMWTTGGAGAENEAEKQVRAWWQRFDCRLRSLGLLCGQWESARDVEARKLPNQTGKRGTVEGWIDYKWGERGHKQAMRWQIWAGDNKAWPWEIKERTQIRVTIWRGS